MSPIQQPTPLAHIGYQNQVSLISLSFLGLPLRMYSASTVDSLARPHCPLNGRLVITSAAGITSARMTCVVYRNASTKKICLSMFSG